MRKKSTRSIASSKATKAISSVRIIGGQFKRRQLSFIDATGLRPTPDRLRETLFNWLMNDLYEARVLDCCAGSGVLGFEALSRGASHCTFIEANPKQSQLLLTSAEQLNLNQDRVQILTGLAENILNQSASTLPPFDLVFIDPPYELNLWQPIMEALINQDLITKQTLLYIEADKPIERLFLMENKVSDASTVSPTKICLQALKSSKVGQIHAGLYQLGSSR